MCVYCPDCPTSRIICLIPGIHPDTLPVDGHCGLLPYSTDMAWNTQRLLVCIQTIDFFCFPISQVDIQIFCLLLTNRPIAIGALITTVLACLLIVVQSIMDHSSMEEGEVVSDTYLYTEKRKKINQAFYFQFYWRIATL